MNTPLISCLCVTRGKPNLLKRAIECFLWQTYENRELIIIYDDDDLLTKKVVVNLEDSRIKVYEVKRTKETTLGSLRNCAILKSNGDYVCQWDDDDWYHVARIECQYEIIKQSGFPSCIMTQWIVYDGVKNRAFVSNKRLWEGSLLCSKKLIKNYSYDDLKIGEDTALIQKLFNDKKLYLINNFPNLYVYNFHGENTWGDDHWTRIFDYSSELSTKESNTIKDILSGKNDIGEDSLILDRILDNPIIEEDSNKTDKLDEFYNEKDPPSKYMKIPKRIHLTYKSKKLPSKYNKCIERLRKLNPNWDITIYDDNDALKIIEEYFPEILNIYNNYPCNIQRVDIFRLLIVYIKGGFYLDMDVFCLKKLDDLCNFNLVLGEEMTHSPEEFKMLKLKNSLQIANYMFGSIAKHPFWVEVLIEAIKRSGHHIKNETDVLLTTGPWMLSDVYHNIKDKYNDIELLRNRFRWCTTRWCNRVSCHFGGYATHLHMGEWRWQSEKKYHSKPKQDVMAISKEEIEATIQKLLTKLAANRYH